MTQVLLSPSGAERFAAASRFVRGFAPGAEVLIVGPTREATDDFARSLVARAAGASSFGLHRVTLTQIAARLATGELARRGLSHTTRLGAEAVAARAVFDALADDALAYFGPVARSPSFARAAAATLEELRLAGVDAAALAASGAPGRDLAALSSRFEEQLTRASIADRALLLAAATDALRGAKGGIPASIALMPKLFLDVPVTSRAEAALCMALAEGAPSWLATVPAGDDRSFEAFASLPRATVVAPAPAVASSPLARLQRHLFSDDDPPDGQPGDEVSFFSAPGEGRECIEIARRIQAEAKRGVALDAIGVFVRAPEIYADLLEHALRRASLPAWFAAGSRRPHPSGRAFLALLTCAAEDLSARRFAEYLSLGQVPQTTASGEPPSPPPTWVAPVAEALGRSLEDAPEAPEDALSPADADAPASQSPDSQFPDSQSPDSRSAAHAGTLRAPRRWERLLVEASVLGGLGRWERRLAGLAEGMRKNTRALEDEQPDAPDLPRMRRESEDLEHLRRFALPVIGMLADFRGEALWGAWLERLEALAPRVLRRPESVLALLSELRPMALVGPVGLDEVRQVLTQGLTSMQEAPPRDRHGRVFVGTVAEARGRTFEVVFVVGLAERLFPKKLREDPILLDTYREQLARPGLGLVTQDERARNERLLLRLAAGAATSRIHLSYPRLEVAEARPRVPSFYGLDVLRATTGHIPESETIERDAANASGARLAWPAPDAPAAAIDDAEHDLAVLGPLMRATDASKTAGRARYLLEQNPHLARSLRARWARWESKSWGAADGLVEPQNRPLWPVPALLADQRLAARPYSVSSLQHFAACPYRFYLASVLRLSPRDEPERVEQMDPRTRGRLFHEVQAAVLEQLRDEGALDALEAEIDAAMTALDGALDRTAGAYRDELAPPIPRVWDDEIERVRADLRAWLRRVAEGSHAWTPTHFELAFGLRPEEGSRGVTGPARIGPGYQLRGAIDLVERHTETGALRVTDYKTGLDTTQPGLTVGRGEVLQPVLYSLALEAMVGAQTVSESRLFFCTTRGGFGERVVPMDDRARDAGMRVLDLVDRSIERGFFLPMPRRDACAFCDYRKVCGPHEEERGAKKNERTLPPNAPYLDLLRLREEP